MPHLCGVVKCGSRGDRDSRSVRFFSLPSELKRFVHKPQLQELAKIRRTRWIQSLKRADLTETKLKYLRVCSKHFMQGKPAELGDNLHPDWVPNINMGYIISTQSSGSIRSQRHERAKRRSAETKENQNTEEQPEGFDFEDAHMETDVSADHPDDSMFKHQSSQTRLSSEEISSLFVKLAGSAGDNSFDLSIEGDDKKTKYFTGLDTFGKFKILVEHLTEFISTHGNTFLSIYDQILLTLIKLRLNLDFKLLAYLFKISATTASSYFKHIISVMYLKLRKFIIWPDREILRKTMPQCFKESLHNKTTVIVDCFEIMTEKPANMAVASMFWSNYKHHYTLKYLIGITPQGTVCYISEAWGGRTSDKHITCNSTFLNNIEPGDVILADRGFLIREYVDTMFADVQVPAFTRGLSQLHPLAIEETRRIANVRIHVERVIGTIRQKYRILSDRLPITIISTTQDQPILDQIVTVCCCLINLCPSVVPMN